VTLTHDPKLDDPGARVGAEVRRLLYRRAGQQAHARQRKERLAEVGISDDQFARIHGPVGLNIGAKSPAEIAVSILGQIIEVKARRLEASGRPKVVAA
jgi:xanthine dehydrogenase accessory factor